jgi:hypothetical protein
MRWKLCELVPSELSTRSICWMHLPPALGCSLEESRGTHTASEGPDLVQLRIGKVWVGTGSISIDVGRAARL